MGDLNYIAITFSFFSMFIIVIGSLINSFEKYLPRFINQSFRYGKLAYKDKGLFIRPIEVPKSWFKHFYIYASILTSVTFALMIVTFFYKVSLPIFVYNVLDLLAGSSRYPRVSNTSAFLATMLLTIQCCRRLYDTHYVSVFSKTCRINLSQYLVGFIHYTGAVLAIVVEAPRFIQSTSEESSLYWNDLSLIDLLAILLFLWAWWHQFKVTIILANLRKNSNGAVVTEAHKLPHGDWFYYVSSPHLLAEILMYISLTIILWNNITWLYVLLWVLTNQVEVALLNHWWYQEKFSELPKNRKAIIPFIY